MQEVDAEFGPKARLARQQSLSAVEDARCSMGCMGGSRRGKSLADFEFEALFRDCRGFFTNGPRALPQSSVGGGIADNSGYIGANTDADGNNDDDDDLYYKVPSHWQVFCRKVRAEARRNMWRRAVIRPFQYDSFSYAMNFDEGNGNDAAGAR